MSKKTAKNYEEFLLKAFNRQFGRIESKDLNCKFLIENDMISKKTTKNYEEFLFKAFNRQFGRIESKDPKCKFFK